MGGGVLTRLVSFIRLTTGGSKLTFQAWAFRHSLGRRINVRNVSVKPLYGDQFTLSINSIEKTKLCSGIVEFSLEKCSLWYGIICYIYIGFLTWITEVLSIAKSLTNRYHLVVRPFNN